MASIVYLMPFSKIKLHCATVSNDDRASARSHIGDTVADLAKEVHLQPDEFKKWLKSEDGSPLPATPSEKLQVCGDFSVPNIIYVTMGNLKNTKARLFHQNKRIYPWLLTRWVTQAMNKYKDDIGFQGYKVIENLDVSRADLQSYMKNPNIEGWAFFGHGDTDNGRMIVENDERWARPDTLSQGLDHHLGFITLYACDGAKDLSSMNEGGEGWDKLIANPNGTLRASEGSVYPWNSEWYDVPVVPLPPAHPQN